MCTYIEVARLHRSRVRQCAVIMFLLMLSTPLISQVRNTHEGSMCTTAATAASAQLNDTTINLAILLVQFTDVRCRMDANGTSPRYASSDFENLLGSQGVYVSPGMRSPDGDEVFGSMNDYFINMSGGRLRVHAYVINRRDSLNGKPVWITLGHTKQYYQARAFDIFDDSFEAAVEAGLDPQPTDDTHLVTIYAGNTFFGLGGLNPRAWTSSYIMSEVQGRPYDQELADAKFSRIGIHCHEFAHTIWIGHSTGGRADLMYGGTSNGSVEGNAPAPLNAIVRSQMGWARVVPAGSVSSTGEDLPYSLTNPTVYLMKNGQGDQFFVENRRFDQMMNIGGTIVPDYNNVNFFPPAGPHHTITQGIFVWRMNTTGDEHDPGYSSQGLVYASGRYGRTFPENEMSDTDDGVPFPGVSNNRLLNPWSDPRSPYIREADYFSPALFHYTLYVPNTKGGSNCGMEVVSEDRAGGTFHVKFYTSNPPNPALAAEPDPDSLANVERARTVVRQDPGLIHQVMQAGGEIFYRRSTDKGVTWNVASLISSGNGGNGTPCMTISGPALLLAWQMDANDAADTGRAVYVSRSTDVGKSWSRPDTVGMSYHCAPPGAYPSLTGAIDGSATIIYRADRSLRDSSVSHDAGVSWSDPIHVVTSVGGTSSRSSAPQAFALEQNYPNPFNPSTTIRYSVPGRMHVRLSVYNTLGQQVALLVDEVQEDGIHEVRFDADNIASGAYIYRIQVGTYSQTRRFLLIR